MAYIEVRKNGKLAKRAPVDTEKARRGCSIKVGSLGRVQLTLGESKTLGNYEIRIVEDVTMDAAAEAIQPADAGPPGKNRQFATISDTEDTQRPMHPGETPQIEGYQITGKLGEGGMGTVWRAVQLGTKREVALKLLGSGVFGSDKARMRFEREVELAARLEHSGIARVYESGLHHNVHYYAMELIDGVHLDEYIETNNLPPRQIMELVKAISEAVQYAHQRGVIHRDLKPSNIMVTEDGKPCVLDFGLAKPSSEDDDAVTISMPGDVAGTPAYMSPEQAAGHVDQIDTRTDVYSLGVILYRLLIRQYPHELSGTRYEVLRRIAEEEVKRPRDVSKKIDKELEALLLKALAHESSERYASAGDLAADIENYLTGEPLTAKAPTAAYFLRKRLRKHRLPVAITAAVLAALIGMAVYAYVNVTWERNRAEAERQDALTAKRDEKEQRQHAEEEATRAKKERLIAVAAKRAEEDQRRRAEREIYRYGILEADRLSLAGMYNDARKELNTLEPRLRGWEYGHLLCRSVRRGFGELLMLKGDQRSSQCVAFSLDGKCLATAGYDNDKILKLWDTVTGKELLTLRGHSNRVCSVAFSPDGKRLALRTLDKTITLWDAATGKELLTIQGHSGGPNNGRVNSIAFSPDGKRLVSVNPERVKFRDSSTGKELFVFKGHSDDVRSVAFSPDGKRMASIGRTIKLWDAATGKELLTLNGHLDWVDSVTFSRDGKCLASGSQDDTIRLWDTATGKELFVFKGHSDDVRSVAFSPDGKRMSSGSKDKTIKLWDAATGKELLTLKGHLDWVNSVTFSRDGKCLASGSRDDTIRLWDTATGDVLLTLNEHSGPVESVAFLCDDKRLASVGWFAFRLWDTAVGEEQLTLRGHLGRVHCVVFSPDGKKLASGSDDGTIRFWEAFTGKELLTLKASSYSVFSVAFSPDGKQLASGGSDGSIKLWDTFEGKKQLTLKGHSGGVNLGMVNSVAFSPNGKRLASGSANGSIKLWDTATGDALLTLKGDWGEVCCVAFSPDGKRLASGSRARGDDIIQLWDSVTGKGLLTIRVPDLCKPISFSPDGKRLVSSQGNIINLWDSGTGKKLLMLEGHAKAVWSVAFSPDGKRLASGSSDKTVKLWDTATGKELLTLRGHSRNVWSVAFSPDGNRLASGSWDKTVKIWDTLDWTKSSEPHSKEKQE